MAEYPGRRKMARLPDLSAQLLDLAKVAVQGTLVEVKVRCGTKSCICHRDPSRKHGPHLYLKFRTAEGRSTGMYIPREHEAEVREAVEAWSKLWESMVEVGRRNRDELARRLKARRRGGK